MTNDRMFLNPGGFAAAFLCLASLLTGCPGPQQPGIDSGMPPDDDGGMPPDDGAVPPDDAWNPPRDGGTDAPDTGTIGDCTDEMMRDRVTPPCDPDTRTGAGSGPTGLEEFARSGVAWFSPGGSCTVRQLEPSSDSMSRTPLYVGCEDGDSVEPYLGLYYYDRDGDWYANYQNRATQEWSHLRVDPGPILVVERGHAGETAPYLMFSASP